MSTLQSSLCSPTCTTEAFLSWAQAGPTSILHQHAVLGPFTQPCPALGITLPWCASYSSPLCRLLPPDLRKCSDLSHPSIPFPVPLGHTPHSWGSAHLRRVGGALGLWVPKPLLTWLWTSLPRWSCSLEGQQWPTYKTKWLFLSRSLSYWRLLSLPGWKCHPCFAFWILQHPKAASLTKFLSITFISLEKPLRKCVRYTS